VEARVYCGFGLRQKAEQGANLKCEECKTVGCSNRCNLKDPMIYQFIMEAQEAQLAIPGSVVSPKKGSQFRNIQISSSRSW